MGELNAHGALVGGVADAAGEVADQKDNLVSQVLELAELPQGDGVAQVDDRAGRIDAQVDADRLAGSQAALQILAPDDLDDAPFEDALDRIGPAADRHRQVDDRIILIDECRPDLRAEEGFERASKLGRRLAHRVVGEADESIDREKDAAAGASHFTALAQAPDPAPGAHGLLVGKDDLTRRHRLALRLPEGREAIALPTLPHPEITAQSIEVVSADRHQESQTRGVGEIDGRIDPGRSFAFDRPPGKGRDRGRELDRVDSGPTKRVEPCLDPRIRVERLAVDRLAKRAGGPSEEFLGLRRRPGVVEAGGDDHAHAVIREGREHLGCDSKAHWPAGISHSCTSCRIHA